MKKGRRRGIVGRLRETLPLLLLGISVLFVSGGTCRPASTFPPPTDEELDRWIGRMLMVGFRGTDPAPDDPILKEIRELHLGGVILFDFDVPTGSPVRNIVSPEQVRSLTETLRAASDSPLLIAVDQEGGRIARLKPARGFAETLSAARLGRLDDEEATRENAALIARELHGLGINLNFAPVVDLAVNPENPIIARLERSYGADPESVTRHARWTVEEFRRHGVLSALKHFPGHGSSREDSHLGLPDVSEVWRPEELEPFRTLIREGAPDLVMTAHLFNRKWDPELPATLSARVLTDLLRGELGFEGVIVSDDMQMGAIVQNFGFEEAILSAVKAGVDLLVFANNARPFEPGIASRAARTLRRLVEEGRIPPERLHESYLRIGTLMRRLEEGEFMERSDGNWPSFRGPYASGVAYGRNPPYRWDLSSPETSYWKTPIPGLGHSSPVIWGDRLFVTTAVSSADRVEFRHGLYGDIDPVRGEPEHEWRLYCLDKNTGEVLWYRTAHRGRPEVARHPKASHASSTPATDGTRVVAFFGSEGLYCYDLEGRLLWSRNLGVLDAGWLHDPSYQWGTAASPVIHQDLVLLQCDLQTDSFLAAFRLQDGETVWRTPRDEVPSWSTPTVVSGDTGAEIVTNGSRYVRGYDPETGEELWRLGPSSDIAVPTPVSAHGLVFVTSGYRPIQPIYAVRPGGRGDLSPGRAGDDGHLVWSHERGGPYIPTPIVYGAYLYTLSNNGILTCYRARDGEMVYRERVGGRAGAYTASPVAADGRLYLTSEDGEVFVVEAGPRYRLLAENRVPEVCMATPAISGDRFFLRTISHVYGIGP